jgi:DNA-binding MarR family transcriptional regulator
MSDKKDFGFETLIFDYIDQLKFLFFPDQWSNAFLDYSKNEILALLLLYRKKTVNMTEIAEYINAPLNTATGVVARLEKKLMVERLRDGEDRRIVNILLTEKAEAFIYEEKKLIGHYFTEVYEALTNEEKTAAISIVNKVISTLKQDKSKGSQEDKPVKKIKKIIIE